MRETRYLPPILLQIAGLLLLLGSGVFWAFTQRESVLMVASAMSLILLGRYVRFIDDVLGRADESRRSDRARKPDELDP